MGAAAVDSKAESVPTVEPSARGGSANPTIVDKDALIGRVLDNKYQIVSPLGEGGMGAVYRARRVHIGDDVAVKVLHPRFVNDDTLVERFRREARAAAQLHHPNIVTIHDYGEAGGAAGFAYIVMELVQGASLRGLLQSEGRLEPARAVTLMRDICSGVSTAHRRQIVHRDLKPDNIIVLPPDDDHERERVKVVDFGIAKLRDMASDSTLTQAGAVVGTPYYMSPEQCRGESLDARADVYSLGAMFYEMLAGAPPFTAPSVTGVIAKHLTEAPPRMPEALNIPRGLQEAIMRSLAKEPDGRQKDAAEFAREIQTASGSVGTVAATAGETTTPVAPVGQQPTPAAPIQPPPSQIQSPPVPTAHPHTPQPTDPRQFAPQTHTQPPPHQPPPQQPQPTPPPSYHPAPAPPRKSRAPLVIGLVVLSLIAVSVIGIVGLIYIGSNLEDNTNQTPIANQNSAPANANQTTVYNSNQAETSDDTLTEAMKRAESKALADMALTREDLAALTPAELRLLRNTLFARHGRVFQDGELKQYFEGRGWYEPNANFNENLLTANDRANAELIKAVESGDDGGSAAPPANAAAITAEVRDTLDAWVGTTNAKLLDLHMIYYADTLDTYYRRTNVSADTVRADRARAFESYDAMNVELSNLKIAPDSTGERATATFDKTWDFESAEKHSTGSVRQQLTLTKVGGRWLITGERDLEVHYSNSVAN
jgi:serine/threonine-protein kinase